MGPRLLDRFAAVHRRGRLCQLPRGRRRRASRGVVRLRALPPPGDAEGEVRPHELLRGQSEHPTRLGVTARADAEEEQTLPDLTVNGCRLWYDIKGEGDDLLQIGGAGFAHMNFSAVSDRMAEHFRVIEVDQR